MAGEHVGESAASGTLEAWLDAKADELGVGREELLARLLPGAGAGGGRDELGALRREFVERLAATHGDFEAELDETRAAFDEKIEDVRDRVVQVKRETDEKAPADHDHPELAPAEVADRADKLADELDELADTVADIDETVETGFDNYEDVLEYLTDATDDLEEKLTTLAAATVELRDRTETLAARHATRSAADELAHLANRRGVRSADCGHCGETVHVGLLAAPKCPHCASTFSDVEPKRGLFGSHTLVVGDPPALEGERADWAIDGDAESSGDRSLEALLEDDE